MSGALRIALVLLAAAAAAIAANVVLLGVASGPHDPVGRLSSRPISVSPAPGANIVRPGAVPHAGDLREYRDD